MHDVEFLPLTGSPGELGDLSATAARAAGALAETRTGLSRVEHDLEGHVSEAVDTARQLLAELRAEADLCAEMLGQASRALAGSSSSLLRVQQDAQRAILARDEARRRVDRAADDEATALRIAADPFDPRQPDGVRMAWLARMSGGEARTDVVAAESLWRQARDAKQADSRQTASRLTGLAHVRAVRLASAASTGLTAYTTSWQSGLDLAGLVQGASPGMSSETRAAARDELLAALRTADGDPVLWTAFWEATTPAELYAVLGVAPVDDDVTVALADGLAAWAESAVPSEQEALGRALVENLPDSFVELGDRAELAAAVLAPSLPSALHVGAADALVERRQQHNSDADLVATGSLTVAIADGLAAHPPAALEHLAPQNAEATLGRAHVWFGMTPTDGWPDEGTAVTGLLAAAVGAGTRTDDIGRQSRTALLTSAATKELVTPGNGLLAGPYPVSDAASRNVADAYAPYLASAGDAVQWQQHDRPRPEAGLLGTPQLAEGTGEYAEIVQPHLDAFAFRDVIAATSSTEASSGFWLERVDAYLDDAVTGVTAEGRSSADAEALAEGATRDAAAVLGAVESESITIARAQHDEAAATATWFSSGLSLATTRSPAGASLAATGVGALLPPLLPDGVGTAREEVLTTEPRLRERTTERFHDAVGDQLAARGYSAEEVERATERLDPNSDNMREVFGSTYAINADLRRELGELT